MTTTEYKTLHQAATAAALMGEAFQLIGTAAKTAATHVLANLVHCPKCNGRVKGEPSEDDWEDAAPAGTVGCFDCDHSGTMEGFLTMQRHLDDGYGWYYEHDNQMRALALKLCWTQRCAEDRLPWYAAFFYTFKAWWCLKANWEGQMPDCDTVNVCTMESRQDGYGWDATWLVVGQGIFSNWEAEIMHDSETTY